MLFYIKFAQPNLITIRHHLTSAFLINNEKRLEALYSTLLSAMMVRVCQLYTLRDQFILQSFKKRERERERQTDRQREREKGGEEENSRYPLSETVTGLDKLT